jgi:protease-4
MRRAIVGLFLLLLAAPAVRAQNVQGTYSHTRDMQMPAASVASCPGPLSLGYNPAELAWGPSMEMLYLHQERLNPDGSENFFKGRADGLLFSLGRLGLGIQWVRPWEDDDENNYLKYTIAAPLVNAGRWFSLAYGIEILDPTRTNRDPSIDFMAGALVRPLRYLSFGLVGRNLGRARIGEEHSEPTLDVGMAIRPLWFAPERVSLAADVRLVKTADEEDVDPEVRFTGHFSIIEGINVFGTADLDGNFGAGLMVDFLRVGAGSYMNFANDDGVEPDNLLFAARLSRDIKPGFVINRGRTAEFVLDHSLADSPEKARSFFRKRPTLQAIEGAIDRAAEDIRVDSILMKVEDPNLEWTAIQELHGALADFKKRGKKVFFHLENATNLSYYLASIGDAVYLAPAGRVVVTGPRVEALFLRGTLDLLGVRTEFKRVGKYKSAVEQLVNEEPSEPYREVLNSLADEMADQLLSAIADGRGLPRPQVQALVDRGLMQPAEAKEAGLLDAVIHFDGIDTQMEKILGHSPSRMDYLRQRWHRDRWADPPTIAVVYATGTIAYGDSFGGGMSARQIAEILSALRSQPGVDAVVLRVDSPGGSGSASDLVWREVARLKEVKPVVVSMAGVAASGGYYISCPADVIVANPGTITGSIGVFSLLFDLSELYARIGVSKEIVKRGRLADVESTFRARTEEELVLFEKLVRSFYQGFIEKVAEGRKLSVEEVDAVGQGRVWTGRQAQQKKLVDELGGLRTAVAIAKQKLGLQAEDRVRVISLPRPRFSFGSLLREVGILAEEQAPLPALLADPIKRLALLAALSTEPTVTMLPFFLTIK